MSTKITSSKHLATNHDTDVVKIKTERNGLGLLKTLIIVLVIALQFAFALLSYLYVFSAFRYLQLFSYAMTIATCIYVLSSNKNSQSKPIWILFLILCSSFGYIVYILCNEKVFWGSHKKRYNNILNKSYQFQNNTDLKTTNPAVKSDCEYLNSAGNFATYSNTISKYYLSGATLFDDVLNDIDKAKNFIFIEFFIISDGVLLNRIIEKLEKKVSEGVDVRIIYDDLGSHGTFKLKTKKRIKNAGIKLYSFNKILPWFSAILNYRDHRKMVIIDGKIAYTGGTNLADEYVNEKRMHGYWKDAGIRLDGPAVDGFTLMFLRQWEFVTKKSEHFSNYLNLANKHSNTSLFVPYADGLEYEANLGKNAYTNMIANANKKLFIMSPYFVIDDTITNLLISKAKSGVDVRIILPEIADKKIVYIISRNNAEKLTSHGVKLYTMKNSFVHTKVMMNEHAAIIGSINMDLRSFYQQFECAIYTNDKQIMSQLELDFEDTFKKSNQIEGKLLKRNDISFRIVAGIVNLISPFM